MNKTIKEINHDFIPLPTGIRLAYRAWMPVDADRHPVPAILEFLPYRKNDGTISRDEITMPSTAENGYACIRVDIRGTGESEGFFDDEYSEQELSDAEHVIHWISQQAWCDGNVGMVGISWGGFNALQLAYRQPRALKAIITICSTDDRFNEDIHFAGGCLLNDNLDWASFFWSYAQARCPDPRLVGDDWKQRWLHRLENMPFLADRWIAEQRKSGKPVEYIVFPDEGHGFARPENSLKFYAAAEAFLAKYLGGRAEPPSEKENVDELRK